MNRRFNTVLFLLGATLLNVLLMLFFFLAFQGLASLFVPVRQGVILFLIGLGALVAAVAATWFAYRVIFQVVKEHLPLDRYFDQDLFKNLFQ